MPNWVGREAFKRTFDTFVNRDMAQAAAARELRRALDAWAANGVETPSLADCRIVPGPIANPIVPKDKAMQPAITAAWSAFIAATDPPADAGEVGDE